jgi:hypothetical protein
MACAVRACHDQRKALYDNRPLESLAAVAITFVAGMLSAVALVGYTRWLERRVD